MSLKTEKDKVKQLQDKCQSVLNALLRDEDNKYCVDCDSKGPRWASWNIGVFLCIRCAGIHRNLGVHISKVKSVNLDAWTPEQVVSLQQMGNSRARAVYEANLPDNFRRPQNDTNLETFIRAKYEHKKYIAREWVPPPLPKVNWEKEIDEEIEKQKRKKKTTLEKRPFTNVEVPQLPKPTNPSPKPSRSVSNTPETKEKKKHNTNSSSKDLLGINGEDNFSSFISAPPAQISSNAVAEQDPIKKPDVVYNAKSEEESFFNQTLPVEKEKVKLDKDSILALYGSAPKVTQFQNSMQTPFQTTAGFQPAGAQAQQGFASFVGFPQAGQVQNFPVQNGLPVQPQFLQQSNGVFPNWGKIPNATQFPQAQAQNQFIPNQFAQSGPFQSQPSSGASVPCQFPTTFPSQLSSTHQQQFSGNPVNASAIANVNFASSMPGNNAAFFGNQSLQQQFGNLTLNGAATAAPGPNIWQ